MPGAGATGSGKAALASLRRVRAKPCCGRCCWGSSARGSPHLTCPLAWLALRGDNLVMLPVTRALGTRSQPLLRVDALEEQSGERFQL